MDAEIVSEYIHISKKVAMSLKQVDTWYQDGSSYQDCSMLSLPPWLEFTYVVVQRNRSATSGRRQITNSKQINDFKLHNKYSG